MALVRSQRFKARKEYDCMTKEWFEVCEDFSMMTFAERRLIVNARNDGFKIRKGQTYLRQEQSEDGMPWTFYAIPELHAICLKYDLYQYP